MSKFQQSLKRLEFWFERQKRVLPWREEATLYRVWVSEIMLQQTQVATVVPYFERFLARFPTVDDLALASQDEVLKFWAGLGYYSRARNLHCAARQIIAQRGFPKTREGWLALPGVGAYTAGAIVSIALDQPEPILDGNVERVLSRARRVSRVRGDVLFKARLWRLSRIFVERGHQDGIRPSRMNQALMELGATLCSPKSPKCLVCPLLELCRGAAYGDAGAFPPRKKSKKWIRREETLHGFLDGRGRILLRKRGPGEWREGLWDLLEEKPTRGAEKLAALKTRYVVTKHKVERTTELWSCKEPLADSHDLRWISLEDPDVALGAPVRKLFQAVKKDF